MIGIRHRITFRKSGLSRRMELKVLPVGKQVHDIDRGINI